MANTRKDKGYEQQRILVSIPSTIKRKMIGSKRYKKERDAEDVKETPDQN